MDHQNNPKKIKCPEKRKYFVGNGTKIVWKAQGKRYEKQWLY